MSLVDVREAAADAFATAVQRWPPDGVPPNPGAWLTTTANRKAIDRIRRENKRDDKQKVDRGVVFEEYDSPGLRTSDGIASVEGNYPSTGANGERAAWFRDSEGNLIGVGQPIP